MPKRTMWLTAGVALGAGSTLWAERRVRRAIEQTAAKLAPDALVAEVGRTARHVAESTGDRFRDAYNEGRDEMYRREEELWSDLATRGVVPSADGTTVIGPVPAADSIEVTGVISKRLSQRGDSSASSFLSGSSSGPSGSTPSARGGWASRRLTKRATERRPVERSGKSPSHLGK
jgi:hypothetical protein